MPASDDAPLHQVFLSYSRKDEDRVLAIECALEKSGKIEVLRDKEDIYPAEDWKDRLENLIVSADAVVFCMSPDSLVSDVVAWEIEVAVRLSKRIVPAVLRDGGPKPPPEIARLNYVFLDREEVWKTGFDSLRNAITTEIGWVREHTRLGELAHRWEADRRPDHELIRGGALDAAETWLADRPLDAPPPSTLHRDFIAASRQNAVRRQRIIVSASLGVAAMALGLSALAYWQRGVAIEQRTEATARSLAAEAQVVLADPLANGGDAVRDLLISRALSPSQAADDALDRAMRRLPPKRKGRIVLSDHKPGSISFDPTGRWLAMAGEEAVSIWAVDGGALRLRHPITAGAEAPDIHFTSDGAHALVIRRPAFGAPGNLYAMLLSLDTSNGAETRELTGVLDARVDGSTVLLLQVDPAGAMVVDALSGTILRRIALDAGTSASGRFSVTHGTLFREGTSYLDMMMMPMMPMTALTPRQVSPIVVLIDQQGVLYLGNWDTGTARRIPIADGARPIALDSDGGHLALRHPEIGDSVMAIAGKEPVWTARNGQNSFKAFVPGGHFIVVEDERGARIESLSASLVLRPENARRTDWDVSAMTDLSEYNSIVSMAIAPDEGLIVTGRTDGRITVWRPGMAPRYGSWGAFPMPNFERVARFDHGDAFGAQKPFWVAPPNLFVSDDGRFVASQSLRLKTNPVGGVEQFDPVLRIWSVNQGTEIARLDLKAPAIAVFAPNRPLMALGEMDPEKDGGHVLSLWDLSTAQPRAVETREILKELVIDGGDARVAPQPGKKAESPRDEGRPPSSDNPAQSPEGMLVEAYKFLTDAQRVWVGIDLKLRARPTVHGSMVTLDDLSSFRDVIEKDLDTRLPGLALDQLSAMADTAVDTDLAAPLPINIDGEFAFLAIGEEIRVYALGDRPRHLRTQYHAGGPSLAPVAIRGAADGRTAAVVLVQRNGVETDKENKNGSVLMEVRVLREGASDPVYVGTEQLAPTLPMTMRAVRVLAIGPKGQQMLVERLVLPGPETGKQLMLEWVLVPFDSGRSEQRLGMIPFSPMHAIMAMMSGGDGRADALAGFDATGSRVVLLHEEPDCPMKAGMSAAMLPITIPSCPGRRIIAEIYATETGERVRTGTFLVESDAKAAATINGMLMTFMGASSPDTVREITLSDAGAQPLVTVKRESIEAKQEIGQITMTLVRRIRELAWRNDDDPLRNRSCSRLPGATKALSLQSWTRLVPKERYRQVCP